MTRQVILAGCAALPRGSGDESTAVTALEELGASVDWARWSDPDVDFAAADLVVLRATWDYPDRRAEFLDWCDSVPRLANPAGVARWNTDKRYLRDLAGAGVPIVPTDLLPPGSTARWPETEFVMKPAVGVGSIGAARFAAAAKGEAQAHLEVLHDAGHTVLLQPYQAAVDAEGETAMVFLGGVFSHAFTKGAMLTGNDVDGSGLFVSERLGVAAPEAAFRALAEDVLDTAAGLLLLDRTDLLYARVDLVRADDGGPALLELELTEPSLGFAYADAGAALRFASAVRARLG